jgi:hypothetical protein
MMSEEQHFPEPRRISMDIREKLDEALKDLSLADEEMLDAFFAFANEHLEQAVQTVNEINQMLKEIKQELAHEPG